MCYAVSVGADPLGPYYRYEFIRPLFPDYPRPAIWPDGYYVPSSTGDDVIQKHACVADRARMLQGLPATEQCIVIDGVNFLNNADIDGHTLPPLGAPNIMMAAGGSQLRRNFEDDGIYAWQVHVDWDVPANTGVSGPIKIPVAPYHYLCNGQLTRCVPQPGDSTRLDAQGDKLMQRLVYRNVGGHESILAEHSINTSTGGGGVRWYEFRVDAGRIPVLYQQGTYAPDSLYRWMASMGMDRAGNIGVGYSFGGVPHFPGQRFAGRLADDPPGLLSLRETVMVEGAAAQSRATRWEDYTTTAMDPSDDCTFWYVGDYVKAGATGYSSRIGGFRMPGCRSATVTGSAYLDLNHDGARQSGEPGIPRWRVEYAGAQAGSVITDASGTFTVSLPADPAYAPPDYTFTAPAATRGGWTATGTDARVARGPAQRNGWSYRMRLADRDFVTAIDFGSVCTVVNRGAHDVAWWIGPGGEKLLLSNESAWRRLVDTTLHLDRGDGSRFAVTGSPGEAFRQLREWLSADSPADAWRALSVQAAVAAFNTGFAGQDAGLTLADSVRGDWVALSALVTRASDLILERAAARGDVARRYADLLARVNSNRAMVTPSRPERCPRPF
jgi:hypothetical protein